MHSSFGIITTFLLILINVSSSIYVFQPTKNTYFPLSNNNIIKIHKPNRLCSIKVASNSHTNKRKSYNKSINSIRGGGSPSITKATLSATTQLLSAIVIGVIATKFEGVLDQSKFFLFNFKIHLLISKRYNQGIKSTSI